MNIVGALRAHHQVQRTHLICTFLVDQTGGECSHPLCFMKLFSAHGRLFGTHSLRHMDFLQLHPSRATLAAWRIGLKKKKKMHTPPRTQEICERDRAIAITSR